MFFFCEFVDLGFVSVHKHAKEELGQYPAILTSHLVNNPYVIIEMIVNLLFHQYDVPTYVGMLEEEVKDELMETDVPSEGKDCPCIYLVIQI